MISPFEDLLGESIGMTRRSSEAMRAGIARFEEYRSSIPFIANSYARLLLRKTAEFELVAMQWAPESKSPIHDHGNSGCRVRNFCDLRRFSVENFQRLDDGLTSCARIAKDFDTRLIAGQLDHRLNWREPGFASATPPATTFSPCSSTPRRKPITPLSTMQRCFARRAQPEYDAIFEF